MATLRMSPVIRQLYALINCLRNKIKWQLPVQFFFFFAWTVTKTDENMKYPYGFAWGIMHWLTEKQIDKYQDKNWWSTVIVLNKALYID